MYSYFLIFVEVGNLQIELARPLYSYFLIFVEVGNLQIELASPQYVVQVVPANGTNASG